MQGSGGKAMDRYPDRVGETLRPARKWTYDRRGGFKILSRVELELSWLSVFPHNLPGHFLTKLSCLVTLSQFEVFRLLTRHDMQTTSPSVQKVLFGQAARRKAPDRLDGVLTMLSK